MKTSLHSLSIVSRQSSNSLWVRNPHSLGKTRHSQITRVMEMLCFGGVFNLHLVKVRFIEVKSEDVICQPPNVEPCSSTIKFQTKTRHHSPLTSYGRKFSPDLHDSHIPPLRRKLLRTGLEMEIPNSGIKIFFVTGSGEVLF